MAQKTVKKAASKKLTLEELVEQADAAKKVNPLDLSSDQDLSVALMNLISLEEHFFFSGAKTRKTGFYDMIHGIGIFGITGPQCLGSHLHQSHRCRQQVL